MALRVEEVVQGSAEGEVGVVGCSEDVLPCPCVARYNVVRICIVLDRLRCWRITFQPNHCISTSVHRDRNAHRRVAHDIQEELIAPFSMFAVLSLTFNLLPSTTFYPLTIPALYSLTMTFTTTRKSPRPARPWAPCTNNIRSKPPHDKRRVVADVLCELHYRRWCSAGVLADMMPVVRIA